MQVVWIQVMERSEFMVMLYWLVRPIKQKKFALAVLQKTLNISFAFCLPGAASEPQSGACSHELVPPICLFALPHCCGRATRKEETIRLKRAKFSIAEGRAAGWPGHLLRCEAGPASSDYRSLWKLAKVKSEMTHWRGEWCKYQRIWYAVLTHSDLAKLSKQSQSKAAVPLSS